ncbi:hypothetical protein HY448_00250 [Candidatus Pacearchaeota archaeon]|nr:hypothetical protein [Candidatus Pacearchaeota archaeon]
MKEEIVEGLKMALTKGETLQQAMQSFYNSGYDRAEIEQAAREVQGFQSGINKESFSESQTPQNPKTQNLQQSSQNPSQVVSNYGQSKSDNSTLPWVAVTMVFVLFIGVALTAVYLYREDVIQFLSDILS